MSKDFWPRLVRSVSLLVGVQFIAYFADEGHWITLVIGASALSVFLWFNDEVTSYLPRKKL